MTNTAKTATMIVALLAALAAPVAPVLAAGEATAPSLAIAGENGHVASPTYGGLDLPGATLPSSNGSQGAPESLNGLPPGALDHTPAMQRHEALQSYRDGTAPSVTR